MQNVIKKILPPTLFIISAIIIIVMRFIFEPILGFPYHLVGIPVFIFGNYMFIKCSSEFERQNTNIETFSSPNKLITTGLYQYSRNPMYLGFALSLTGISLFTFTLQGFFVVVMFVIITDHYYIKFEESAMMEVFGEDYSNYKIKVRRWF